MSRADHLKEEGNRHFNNKDYVKAIKSYKEGLDINPGNWILNNNIAQAYLANSNYRDAEMHAVVTVCLQDNSVKGFYRAAKAAYHLNKIDRAMHYIGKGLEICPTSDDLKSFSDQLKNHEADLSNGYPEKLSPKTGAKEETETENNGTKERSRSVSGSRAVSGSSSNDAVDGTNKRSTSISRLDTPENDTKGKKKKSKVTRGPIEIKDIQNDNVLKTVEDILGGRKVNMPVAEKTTSLENIRMNLWAFMKDGSEAFEKGLSRRASEKFKSAVDIIVVHNFAVFGLKEIDCVVLRYSLSISYIETANYGDITKSLDYLNDIEEKHSVRFPAVYYALGNAFCKLNRFRVALEHLDKGMKVIDKGFKITAHPWPGTINTIKETTKVGLKESLESLINHCKTYKEPDAVCRFGKCLEISIHIIPSNNIFYSDPDYSGHVVVICEANCGVTFHINCWKAFKESLSDMSKLSDKEILGRQCFTSDCVSESNVPSVIVKIEIYDDACKVKSSCSKDPIRNTNNISKENKKEKKKKNDRTGESILNVKNKTKQRMKEKKTKSEPTAVAIKDMSPVNTSDISMKLKKIDALRKMNFGYSSEIILCPDRPYFGHSDFAGLENYLIPECVGDSEELKNRKEFIFTYFVEYIKNEGPQKLKDIEEKWRTEASQFPGVSEFMPENEGICNFLLQSYHFAVLDDYLCVTSQLPVTYSLVESELSEGLLFKLSTKSDSLPVAIQEGSSGDHQDAAGDSVEGLETILENDDDDLAASNSSHEMYYSDSSECLDSESEEEEDKDQEDEEEGGLIVEKKSDKSLNADLNPDAKEFLPPVEIKAMEHLYDHVIGTDTGCPIERVSNNTTPFDGQEKNSILGQSTPPNVKPPSVEVEIQTEPDRHLEKQIDILSAAVKNLQENLEKQSKSKMTLEEKYAKDSATFQEKVKLYEEKMVHLEGERLKEIKALQSEMSKKDSSIDTMKKKHNEQIDALKKMVADNTQATKEMESKVQELTVLRASLNLQLEEHKKNEKEILRQLLDTKKSFVEYKISLYLSNCFDKVKTMNSMLKYLTDTSKPTLNEMKDAIKKWEGVQKEVEMINAQFRIQYAVLSQELDTKGYLSESKNLTVAELPAEPSYPVEDMEMILQRALEKISVPPPPPVHGGGDASMLESSHVNTSNACTSSSSLPPSHPYLHPAQGQNIYMTSTSPVPFRYGTYQTGAFGGVQLPVPMPPQVAVPTAQPAPMGRFMPNGPPMYPMQDGINSANMPKKPLGPPNGFQTLPVDPKSRMEVPKKTPAVTNKFEVVGGQRVSEEKKKHSSVAGLTPIESKTTAPSTETNRKSGAVPKTQYKPNTFTASETRNNNSSASSKMWKYEKLLSSLRSYFRTEDDEELTVCLAIARERNNNSLSGLTVPAIHRLVAKILQERSDTRLNNSSMAMDKFDGCPWGSVKDSHFEWNKPVDESEECIICHFQMTSGVTPLLCKHAFHTECIRKWLKNNSTCPICRKYTTLNDEFPPLA